VMAHEHPLGGGSSPGLCRGPPGSPMAEAWQEAMAHARPERVHHQDQEAMIRLAPEDRGVVIQELEALRRSQKHALVRTMNMGNVFEHTVHAPNIGQQCFFDIEFENPYGTDEVFVFEYSRATGLQLLNDPQRIHELRESSRPLSQRGVEPPDGPLFAYEADTSSFGNKSEAGLHGEGSGARLFLRANESVRLPLTYTAWGSDTPGGMAHYAQPHLLEWSAPACVAGAYSVFLGASTMDAEPGVQHGHGWEPWCPVLPVIKPSSLQLSVRQLRTWSPAATINIRVLPLATTVHRRFYLWRPEHLQLRFDFVLPAELHTAKRAEVVGCRNAAAYVEKAKKPRRRGHRRGEAGEGRMQLRVSMQNGARGTRQTALVHLYHGEEAFHFDGSPAILETWQLLVEAVAHGGEVTARVGESSQHVLPNELRGALEVWTSHPDLRWDGAAALVWQPRAVGVASVQVLVTARMAGHTPMRKVLIEGCTVEPRISHVEKVVLKAGTSQTIRIPFSNPQAEDACFTIQIDRQDAIHVRGLQDDGGLWLHALEQIFLEVEIRPRKHGTDTTALLFVNDRCKNAMTTIDCFQIDIQVK